MPPVPQAGSSSLASALRLSRKAEPAIAEHLFPILYRRRPLGRGRDRSSRRQAIHVRGESLAPTERLISSAQVGDSGRPKRETLRGAPGKDASSGRLFCQTDQPSAVPRRRSLRRNSIVSI